MAHRLAPGERLIVSTRPQARSLALPVFVFLLVPALCAFGAGWLLRNRTSLDPAVQPWVPAAVWTIAGVGIVLIVLYSVRPLLRWVATHYVLTNWRLMTRRGWLRRREEQSYLSAIYQLRLSQSLVQRALRCGNITADLGYGRTVTYFDVPEVARFHALLTECIERLPHTAMIDGAGFDTEFAEGHNGPWDAGFSPGRLGPGRGSDYERE